MTETHTEPITIAAEQGLVGIFLYLALLGTALWTMTAGLGASMPGLGRAPPAAGDPAIGRAAVLAMFVALIVHTLAYAGFYEDPITWVVLAMAGSLAIRPSP